MNKIVLFLITCMSLGALHASWDGLLIDSAEDGSLYGAQLALKNGANVNESTWFDYTPLILASRAGHDSIVALLIEHKAKLDKSTTDSMTALHEACKAGKAKCVQLLLRAGAEWRRPDVIQNWTPMD